MELLSFSDFSQRFPIEGVQDSPESWARLLKRYRDEGKLTERKGPDCLKWQYRLVPQERATPVRKYKLHSVVLCICREAQFGTKNSPMSRYLFDTYRNEFCTILESEQAASPSSSASDK